MWPRPAPLPGYSPARAHTSTPTRTPRTAMECGTTFTPQPMFLSHQLVGDSLLLRFAEQMLGQRRRVWNRLRFLGLCVSGQTIDELRTRVRTGFAPVSDKVILLIGTNDLLRGTSIEHMQACMLSLVSHLHRTASQVVILTLPPVPKLCFKMDHWQRLYTFNDFVRQLDNGRTIRVADISSMFLSGVRHCRLDCFEKYGLLTFYGGTQRLDYIHLNRRGLTFIRDHLLANKFVGAASCDDSVRSTKNDDSLYLSCNDSLGSVSDGYNSSMRSARHDSSCNDSWHSVGSECYEEQKDSPRPDSTSGVRGREMDKQLHDTNAEYSQHNENECGGNMDGNEGNAVASSGNRRSRHACSENSGNIRMQEEKGGVTAAGGSKGLARVCGGKRLRNDSPGEGTTKRRVTGCVGDELEQEKAAVPPVLRTVSCRLLRAHFSSLRRM